jgi:pimeloyl-ACP methyl ester carboxylesterase
MALRLKRWGKRIGIAILLLATALTLASVVFNIATNGESKPLNSLYGGRSADVNGRLVAYRQWGRTGTPVVLLGGFAVPSFVWDRVGALLGRRHRVYALDLPPFGYSERKGPYTLASWIELVRAFDRHFGMRRPIVVGHSLAAAVAVGLALHDPADTRGIVLLDGDAIAARGAPSWLSHLLVGPWFTSAYRIVTGSDWIFRRVLKAALGPRHPPLRGAWIERWERPFEVRGTLAAFRSLLRYGIQGFQLPALLKVHSPVAVVWGQDDTVDGVSAGRRSAETLAASFMLIPGAGHLSMVSQPAAVARAIDRFAGKHEFPSEK